MTVCETGPVRDGEPARIASLLSFGVLDTPPEAAFDGLTLLAAQLCDAPISLLSFLDGRRQWPKSRYGLEPDEIDRAHSFCRYAIDSPDVFVVPDARRDPRFARSPLVTGPPHVRFYAGAPLVTDDGHILGTLCVLDHRPRTLGATQRDQLMLLAAQVVAHLEARRSTRDTARELQVHRAALAAMTEQKRLLDGLFGSVELCIFTKDLTGRYVMASAALTRLTRVEGGPIGRFDHELFGSAAARTLRRNDHEVQRSRQPIIFTEELVSAAGESRIYRTVKHPVLDEDGTVVGVAGISTDITELARARAELEHIASTDPLTGALNRRAWADRLDALTAVGSAADLCLVVAVIDVDFFKAYNDTHGHTLGDQLLIDFAAEVRNTLGPQDVFARWGGEEFVVALPVTEAIEARKVLDCIRLSVPSGQTCSIGYAVVAPGEDLGSAIRRADEALYDAKTAGRNRVRGG